MTEQYGSLHETINNVIILSLRLNLPFKNSKKLRNGALKRPTTISSCATNLLRKVLALTNKIVIYRLPMLSITIPMDMIGNFLPILKKKTTKKIGFESNYPANKEERSSSTCKRDSKKQKSHKLVPSLMNVLEV